ncbi:hypothetical protein FNV43_RR15861 [Rhamnella rubrinervis]|uniref:Nudix hydrolase domain-containing protein n=1 Tax=Rhamnella rubrinervis TaxID=2594499 RepID=A0A8K0E9V2_9ROSA|nr:hypothetical protein FNV43_RR15861 [Rhamnella rubrinervis]
MACNNLHLPHRFCHSLRSSSRRASHGFPKTLTTTFPFRCARSSANSTPSASVSTTGSFTWDDVIRISQPESSPDDPSDLKGYFDKIQFCNRGSVKLYSAVVIHFLSPKCSSVSHFLTETALQETKSKFLPFVIENQIVGYIHNEFSDHLRRFSNVLDFTVDNGVTLHSSLRTAEDRTEALGEVTNSLGEKLIPGIRNELYPVVSSFGGPTFFSLERAAAPYFGIKAYGVHMNGYVEKDGQKFLWIGKRSQLKPTYPGMLDHLVAGGLPHGIACGENLVKECEEEAGIPRFISSRAIAVGAVSYMDIDGYRFKRDVLFCYDLKLPESFIPKNEEVHPLEWLIKHVADGEVESFKLIPVTHVANVIRRTNYFKSNCCLVIIDFLFRHG